MNKIALIGNQCSGKTTISRFLQNKNKKFVILSFANYVKKIAKELFNMKEKDRKLLQQIGTKMREINVDCFLNYTIKESKKHKFVLVDDCRYLNELMALKKAGFKIIKINIDKDLQEKRLKNLYPKTFKEHLQNSEHQSETEMKTIPIKFYDLIITTKNDKSIFDKIEKFVLNNTN